MTDVDYEPDYAVRQPPHDLIAEESLLGALLLSPQARLDVIGGHLIAGEDFYRPSHETVFEVIADLERAGVAADAVLVASELQRRGELQRVGGHVALHGFIAACGSSANAAYYAREIRERAVLRRVIMAGSKVMQLGYAADGRDADEILTAAKAEIDGVAGVGRSDTGSLLGTVIVDIVGKLTGDEGAARVEYHWPYAAMRDIVSPARPGQFAVVAARPAVGKSTMLVDCARYWAITCGLRVDLWTREMPEAELGDRILSAEARVPLSAIKSGNLSDRHIAAIYDAVPRIEAAPLRIHSAGGTLTDVLAAARRGKTQVILYDYIGLVPMPSTVRDPAERRMRLGEFSRGLKQGAKDLDAFVLAASQLNRGPEQRQDKRPMLSDLREFGDLEQDVDLAILLDREDVRMKESPRAGEVDCIVAKQRNGPTGEFMLAAQLHYARFVGMAGEATS